MITLDLMCQDRIRHCFRNFYVEAWRSDFIGKSYFCLIGLCSNQNFRYIVWSFPIEHENYADVFNESVDVCDMLNYLLDLKSKAFSDSEALQLVAALYPEHFKYLAEFGYESPPEEGGAADAR